MSGLGQFWLRSFQKTLEVSLNLDRAHIELEASLSGGQGVHRVSLGEVQNEHLLSSVGQEC